MNIFLDMDGVLTDFWGRFETLHGKPNVEVVAQIGYPEYLKCVESYGESFWSFMPWTKDGKELWDYLKLNSNQLDFNYIIQKSHALKSKIVKIDPTEKNIRKKLNLKVDEDYIKTIRGVGYIAND